MCQSKFIRLIEKVLKQKVTFSRYPYLLAELLADPAWSEKDVALLAGLNVLRVFEKVEAVRDQWKLAAVLPGEDTAPPVHSSCSSIYS